MQSEFFQHFGGKQQSVHERAEVIACRPASFAFQSLC
jgi:hypothetical protein